MISYSTNFEDVILHRLFAGKATGFYVDVGAGDPIYHNDTMALSSAGWSGINVEPNAHLFALLVKHRTRDRNLCVAVGNRTGETDFYEVDYTGWGLSTCDAMQAEIAEQNGHRVIKRQVPILTLAQILSEARPPVIDLLKVDVEGFEEQVLRGNDWDRYRPSVIIVEATLPGSPQRRHTGIRNYLEEQGYQRAYFDGLNDFYVERSFVIPQNAFSPPPNVFDKFELLRVVELEEQTNAHKLLIADLEAERHRVKNAAKKLKGKLKRLRAQDVSRRASLFWKLTAPVRAFMNGLERLYRR